MKRIYSFILILSIAAGTLQPALPMMEYMLNHHHLSSVMDVDYSETEGTICALKCALTSIQKECDMDHDEGDKLLDVEYYPVPLKMSDNPSMDFLAEQTERYIHIEDKLLTNYILPNAPPPRILN
ncbi:MAG: hypothetical protein ACQETF_11650 [Bacteroidota bacterium]